MAETFDADWLALREPFDAAARSIDLAKRFAAAMPARPRILDLGAGTGSLFRWLAPIIGREQSWLLADSDATLLERARVPMAEPLIVDLSRALEALPFDAVDGVVCSALLDLVSEPWLYRLAAALRTPLLACLSVDGRDAFLPRHGLDRIVLRAFRRDQGRDKGFGPALGPRAPQVLHAALAARGFTLASAASDWRIPPTATAMLHELIHGHARASAQHLPARRAAIAAWHFLRLQQADRGRLAIRIGHRDSLALPSQE